MIELIFSDSGAALLSMAKESGDTSSICAAEITTDGQGNESIRTCSPEAYTGPRIAGDSAEIASLWLMADVGDISQLPAFDSRTALLYEIAALHGIDEADWVPQEAARAERQIVRLQQAAQSGEAVRVWYSDMPAETSGYYWAMHLLRDAAGPVWGVKVPRVWTQEDGVCIINGTGDLTPAQFYDCLAGQQPVSREMRRAIALQWQTLTAENAPLRAVVSGVLCSVPTDFYDCFLYQAFAEEPFSVAQAVGLALGRGAAGPADWWYAGRIKEMLARGELETIEFGARFYYDRVRKTARCCGGNARFCKS